VVRAVAVAAQVAAGSGSGSGHRFDELRGGAPHLADKEGADSGRRLLLQRRGGGVLHAAVLFHDLVLEDLFLALEVVELI